MGETGGGRDGERSKPLGPLADQYLDRDMRSRNKGGMKGEGRDEMGPPADQY